jgi:hypothetical protein
MPETLDKKKLPVNKAGDKTYPEPDIPVEDAWNNMKQLLQQAPAAPASQSGLSAGKGKLFWGAAGTGMVAIVALITYVTVGKKDKPVPAQTTTISNIAPKSDTLHEGSIAYLNNRIFEFSNTPFKEAVGFIEKAYGVTIIINNNKLNNCTITTRFDNKSLEEILDILGYTLAFEYSIDKNKNQVIISGDGCN